MTDRSIGGFNEDFDNKGDDENGICRCHECQVYINADVFRPIIKVDNDDFERVLLLLENKDVKEFMDQYRARLTGNDNSADVIICCVEYTHAQFNDGSKELLPTVVLYYKYSDSEVKYELFINRQTWDRYFCNGWGVSEIES